MTHKLGPNSGALPEDLIALILGNLDVEQRKSAALVCRAFGNAARATFRARFLDLSLPTKLAVIPAALSPALNEVVVVWGASEAAGWASTAADPSDEYDPTNIWGASGKRTRISAVRWHLARTVKSSGHDHALIRHASRPQQRLQLTLAIPSLTTTTSELARMLEEVGGLGLFTEVSIPRGVATLDGGLAAHLTRCNALGHNLTACLSAPTTYPRLSDLTVKVQSSEEAAGLLTCVTPATLPALRRLTLVAAAGAAGVAADLSTLDHPALTSLLLHGITLEGGFGSLQHLADLSSLSLGYEEDEGPSVNLAGDITALAGLRQLSRLRVQSLACDGGLASLTRLTSLAVSPEGDGCVTVRGLPLLARLSVDLGSESSGWDLLRRGGSAYVPPRHGLPALESLELRCFVWRHWGAESGALSEEAEGGDSGSDAEEEEEEEEEAEEGSEAGEESASDAGSVAGSDDESDMEEEGGEEEGDDDIFDEGVPQVAAGRSLGGGAASKMEEAMAITSLETRYLAALLRRLPSVRSVLFSDYMGLISPPAKHGRLAGPGGVGGAGPGGAAVLRTIAGQTWERTVTETPIQGGISQNDITYRRL